MSRPMIRPATETDLAEVVRVEVTAGQIFRSVGLASIADVVPDMADLSSALARGFIWVAEHNMTVVGHVIVGLLDGNAHVEQVSVAPEAAGNGVGRRLMERVEEWGAEQDCPSTTLTTFRTVPWNAPYYRRLGYAELSQAAVGPELASRIEHEASLPGIDPDQRCAMIKNNLIVNGCRSSGTGVS